MRKIAFGYSTRCNIKCGHCVAAGERPVETKMQFQRAKELICELAGASVVGISFTAGEPFLYFDDIVELVNICNHYQIYTRLVTNCYWAKSEAEAAARLLVLRGAGLSQIRMSYSRWHQEHVPREHIAHAALACNSMGIDYFVSFVTDFSKRDEGYEQYLRDKDLKFFPEPVIYAGRAGSFGRLPIFTDYQENRCGMNAYLAPDLKMYACCDAGSHFTTTDFFLLGSVGESSLDQLLTKSETDPLYNCIRTMGVTNIASFSGMKSREIVTYRKCELCKKMFDDPVTLKRMQTAACGDLQRWVR